jgi:hypothetical protein
LLSRVVLLEELMVAGAVLAGIARLPAWLFQLAQRTQLPLALVVQVLTVQKVSRELILSFQRLHLQPAAVAGLRSRTMGREMVLLAAAVKLPVTLAALEYPVKVTLAALPLGKETAAEAALVLLAAMLHQ